MTSLWKCNEDIKGKRYKYKYGEKLTDKKEMENKRIKKLIVRIIWNEIDLIMSVNALQFSKHDEVM